MATQIVMDATGDTRHEFNPADASAVAEAEKPLQRIDWSWLYRSSPKRRRSVRTNPQLRSDCHRDPILSPTTGRLRRGF
jgi:hypothetical protein